MEKKGLPMQEAPPYEVRSASKALVAKLLDITRGPLPVDQAINLAMQVIFLRAHLRLRIEGAAIADDVGRHPDAIFQLMNRELKRALRHPPRPLSPSGLLSKAVLAMWKSVDEVMSENEGRDLQVLQESFEGVIGLYRTQGLRGESEYMGPAAIVRLSAAIVGPQESYVDPANGYGTTLRAAHLLNPRARLTGFDINDYTLTVAEMRLIMAGGHAELSQGDAFEIGQGHGGRYGGVFLQPPWNVLNDAETLAKRTQLLGNLPASSIRTDLAWVELAHYLMAPGGRSAVFLPRNASSPVRGQTDSHRRLLDLGAVEAVIDFPQGGMSIGAAVPTALWILRKSEELNPSSNVLLVDASTLVEREREGTTLNEVAVDALAKLLEVWRVTGRVDAPGYLAKALSKDQFDLKRKGMLASLYLDDVPEEKVSLPQPPKRMISYLEIDGYKAFSASTRIDLAPLTLVYGANSAGKSSIIQTLLLLKQSIDHDHLVTQGDWADVGNFEGITSGHRNEDINFQLQYGSLPSWIPDKGTADPAALRSIRFAFSKSASGSSANGAISRLNIGWDSYNLSLECDPEGHLQLPLELAEPVMKGIVGGQVLFPFESRFFVDDDSDKRKRNLKFRENRVRAAIRDFRNLGENSLTIMSQGLLPSAEVEYSTAFRDTYSERQRSTDMSHTNRLARLLAGIGQEVRSLFAGISYLGPLRSAPKRYYDRASSGDRPGDGYETAMLLYNNSVIVDGVNEWLAHLEVPYILQMLPVEPQAGVASLVGDLVVMALTDTRSGVQVTPADVGYGVSQMLPIVVKLLTETESVVCIEQPETHLHPRLQARLADLLIASSSAEGQGNQLLVETHSEHLMLRVQRRIREGSLSPEDVSVLYVDQDETGCANVRRIQLSDDGEFLDEWPEGFFEERLAEIFGEGY